MRNKRDIKSMLPAELEEYFSIVGERAYRAEQVFRWLHSGAAAFCEMTNLPETLREKLNGEFYITAPEIVDKQASQSDGSTKYLWRLSDGSEIESVVMEHDYGNTVCVSTQVGCRMGCVFCASTQGGLVRNLAASEILDQVLFSGKELGEKLSNVVLMGIGEPLDNFSNVTQFLKIVTHPSGICVGARHISLSTCGIIENIDKLADYDIQLTLTVSLHAPDDETRSLLMPINRANGVGKLLDTCGEYFLKTGRRISYEYAMIEGVNDTHRHAEELARKLKKTGSHVNLIPLSKIAESPLKASSSENVRMFAEYLMKNGINVTIRRSLGGDISASCGQLRSRHKCQNNRQ
ncbi:MAG: 23S rRNA (adenine(2503)-C(2))-methyltransferase RlmN [Oscillospiraceae bacterium]|nr:23S rRNA (adenine(2503)-C(2))-methyltransferase RlmN [Oscillospiraceae bacterium]